MGFYKAGNGRIIHRGGGGRFRRTTLDNIGMARCEKCGGFFIPDYSNLGERPIDPRRIHDARRMCSGCSEGKEPTAKFFVSEEEHAATGNETIIASKQGRE